MATPIVERVRNLFDPPQWILGVLGHLCGYLVWGASFRILTLTILTYFLRASNSQLQEISETFSSSEIPIVGIGAGTYLLLLTLFRPTHPVQWRPPSGPRLASDLEKRLIPYFTRGALTACGLTAVFLVGGHYQFLGFFLQGESLPLAFLGLTIRILTLGLLLYSEEILFRKFILERLLQRLSPTVSILLTSLLYCVVKAVQFDLGVMHLTTLFLLSTTVGFLAVDKKDIIPGLGYLAGLLIIAHCILGLPILGNSFPGVVFLKYSGSALEPAGFLETLAETTDTRTALFLTGGIGGPLSSFSLQFLLCVQIAFLLWRSRHTKS